MNPSVKIGEDNFTTIKAAAVQYWQQKPSSRKLKVVMSQKDIAKETGLNVRTVKRHYARLKVEMGIY